MRIRSRRILLFVLSHFGLLTPCRRRPQIAAGRLQVSTVRPNELHAGKKLAAVHGNTVLEIEPCVFCSGLIQLLA
jgi:hypothetical protein